MPSRADSNKPHEKPVVAAWILNDQLLDPASHPVLIEALRQADGDRSRICAFIIESHRHFSALPYHKKRLALIISAGRHYAEELKKAGWKAECLSAESYRAGLRDHWREHRWHRLVTMEAVEKATALLQKKLAENSKSVPFEIIPNQQFYWPKTEFARPTAKNVILETFYRSLRKKFQLLMNPDNTPVGGQWNFDADNRKPIPKSIEIPGTPAFESDRMTLDSIEEVNTKYKDHVGTTDNFDMPVTRAQVQLAFQEFLQNRLPLFGPYEDAMSSRSGTLWHSVMSPAMNLGMIDALEMCRAAEAQYQQSNAPLNSVEGFIRQIIGWREYMHWQYTRAPELRTQNSWNHHRPIPQFWWDGRTEMQCLHSIITRLLESGYNHHIERLMVLCNFAMLAGIDPEAVANWFLTMYVDSHDWVVLPNVIGMGLNADGGRIATKPYIASASYINKMSDHCGGCKFDPKSRTGPDACPFNTLYWNFLIQNEKTLRSNPRMGPNVLGLKHISEDQRREIQNDANQFLNNIQPYDSIYYEPEDSPDS